MTYKDVIDRFQSVATNHYMIKDFGYGQLSDIKVHAEADEADYPYLFLNPTVHTRTNSVMRYEFNMIMMDIAIDEGDPFGNWINIQSQCQQYIDDVFAELYYGYTDKPLIDYSSVTYTPFKERFQDSVAGMTAAITIEIPTPINRCDAPLDTYFGGQLLVEAYNIDRQLFRIDDDQSPIKFPDIHQNDGGWRLPPAANFYIPQTLNPIKWVVEGEITEIIDEAGVTEFPPVFRILDEYTQNRIEPDVVIGWPTQKPTEFPVPFRLEWNNFIPANTASYQLVNLKDQPGIEEVEFWLGAGASVKISIA